MHDYIYELKKLLPENPVIIEARACSGADTLELSKIWPKSQIHAFEPNPHTYQMLVKQVDGLSNIYTYNLALGNKIEMADFYVCRHPCLPIEEDTADPSSLFPPIRDKMPTVRFDQVIQVPVVTLDQWAEKFGVDHVDFIWFDMQGAEGIVLQACPKILSTVKVVQAEFFRENFYEDTMLLPDLECFFHTNGFVKVYQHGDKAGDVIYKRADLTPKDTL